MQLLLADLDIKRPCTSRREGDIVDAPVFQRLAGPPAAGDSVPLSTTRSSERRRSNGSRYNPTVSVDQSVRSALDGLPGIAAVYLFGSAARDELGADSDIDIGVLFDSPPPSTLEGQPLDLEGDLERRLGRVVQLVVLNRAPVDLAIRVLRTGQLIVDHNRSARIAFEVRTRNEAFDLEPILRQYRAARRPAP